MTKQHIMKYSENMNCVTAQFNFYGILNDICIQNLIKSDEIHYFPSQAAKQHQ